jgi:hypothetical protein
MVFRLVWGSDFILRECFEIKVAEPAKLGATKAKEEQKRNENSL